MTRTRRKTSPRKMLWDLIGWKTVFTQILTRQMLHPIKLGLFIRCPRRLSSNDVSVGLHSTRKTQIGERGPVASFLGVPRDVPT